jgi:predicted transcriptional regulator
LELYNDILKAIVDEITNDGDSVAKPTRVQLRSNLAYDKLARYLDELENKKMILQSPLLITEKGRDFLQDYDRISNITSSRGGIIPKPTGGLYLKHAANVIVHIKEQSNASTTTIPSFKATLLKHQYIKTPKSAILYIKKTGGVVLLD